MTGEGKGKGLSQSQPCADAGPNSPRSLIVRRLLRLLRAEPQNWRLGSYTVEHEPSGCALWIGNGWLFMGIYSEPKVSFSLFDRWRLYRAVRLVSQSEWAGRLCPSAQDASERQRNPGMDPIPNPLTEPGDEGR